MRYNIKNEKIICEIDIHGAELKSLKRLSDGKEYMWNGDPFYWKRQGVFHRPAWLRKGYGFFFGIRDGR